MRAGRRDGHKKFRGTFATLVQFRVLCEGVPGLQRLLSAGHRLSRALIISGISMAAEYFYPHVGAELRTSMCGSDGEVAKRAIGMSI